MSKVLLTLESLLIEYVEVSLAFPLMQKNSK
jgi:hypothetical protein